MRLALRTWFTPSYRFHTLDLSFHVKAGTLYFNVEEFKGHYKVETYSVDTFQTSFTSSSKRTRNDSDSVNIAPLIFDKV